MTSQADAFSDQAVTRRRRVEKDLERVSLRIAVLGPDLENLRSVGTRKRYQIRDALEDDGHRPFFPERELDTSDASQLWLELERQLLGDESVDLVIIFHTEDGFGVLAEIANFVSVPEIHAKAAILFPAKFYTPSRSLSANTVQAYHDKMQYTDQDMAICRIVDQCIDWASERRNESWPGIVSQGF